MALPALSLAYAAGEVFFTGHEVRFLEGGVLIIAGIASAAPRAGGV
jgi:hypothetical protein